MSGDNVSYTVHITYPLGLNGGQYFLQNNGENWENKPDFWTIDCQSAYQPNGTQTCQLMNNSSSPCTMYCTIENNNKEYFMQNAYEEIQMDDNGYCPTSEIPCFFNSGSESCISSSSTLTSASCWQISYDPCGNDGCLNNITIWNQEYPYGVSVDTTTYKTSLTSTYDDMTNLVLQESSKNES